MAGRLAKLDIGKARFLIEGLHRRFPEVAPTVELTGGRLALMHRLGSGPEWVVTPKCPVVVEEWDFLRIKFGHYEGHLVDATISYSARSLSML